MKLLVIGCGQCGGRIADEFARLNQQAHRQRGAEIVTGAYALNTDEADLSGLRTIKADFQHRILIGGRRTSGHGVGKINELAAEIARQDSDKVVDAIRIAKNFYETDAFLVIASGAGGTGSGTIAVVIERLKERYQGKAVYALVVQPFEHEESAEERCVYNTGTCLRSVSEVADAVILVDNQRYVRKDASLADNMDLINQQIVAPFYDLLCSGEEKKRKYIASKVVDAGDILQTLDGWTTIGFGRSSLPLITFPWERKKNFREKGKETHKAIGALNQAISEISLDCNPVAAGKALYLLSAPKKEMNIDIIKELSTYFNEIAPNAIVRGGDYPREKGSVDVTVVLSQLSEVERVKNFYRKSTDFLHNYQVKQRDVERKLDDIAEAGRELPSLL